MNTMIMILMGVGFCLVLFTILLRQANDIEALRKDIEKLQAESSHSVLIQKQFATDQAREALNTKNLFKALFSMIESANKEGGENGNQ